MSFHIVVSVFYCAVKKRGTGTDIGGGKMMLLVHAVAVLVVPFLVPPGTH